MILKDWLDQGNKLLEVCTLETNTLENKQAYEDFLNLPIDDDKTELEWVCFKCKKSHIATLKDKIIDLKRCPECYKDKPTLKVNDKYGCFTVIGSPFDFMRDFGNRHINNLHKANEELLVKKQNFINTHNDPDNIINSVSYYDNRIKSNNLKISDLQNNFSYFVQCDCGYKHKISENVLFAKERKYCTEVSYDKYIQYRPRPMCGQLLCKNLSKFQDMLKNSNNYDYYDNAIDFKPGDIFECFRIDKYKTTTYSIIRKYTKDLKGIAKVTRWYNCTCYLCGQKYIYNNYDFEIKSNDGIHVSANAKCNCHKYSFLQWQPTDILNQLHISYRVEVSFDDLFGSSGKYLLSYDFGILDKYNKIKALIEVQGSQHSNFCEDLQDSDADFEKQVLHDNLKRDYAKKHNIPLIEIPEVYSYSDIINILAANNIINSSNLPIITPRKHKSTEEINKMYNSKPTHHTIANISTKNKEKRTFSDSVSTHTDVDDFLFVD